LVIVNGVLGDHGATILAARGELALSTDLTSDCAGLGHLMQAAVAAAPGISAARDCTRGGLASALNEMAAEAGLAIELEETKLPLRPEVSGVCELLGLDPLYLANEGRLVLFCPEAQAKAALTAMRALPEGQDACIIGRATAGEAGRVTLRTAFGGARIVDMLVGEQLPRIC
jgi:hydrogenase expression/formation protein HypE